jgi:Lysozyme like domain
MPTLADLFSGRLMGQRPEQPSQLPPSGIAPMGPQMQQPQQPMSAMGQRGVMPMGRPAAPPTGMQRPMAAPQMRGLPSLSRGATALAGAAPTMAVAPPTEAPERTPPASGVPAGQRQDEFLGHAEGLAPGTGDQRFAGFGLGGDVEQWRALVAKYFPANEVDRALAVMQLESSGNPNAHNPRGEDSVGLFQINRQAHPSYGGGFDPEANVRYAAQLFSSQGWRPWTAARVLGFV